MLGTAFVKMAKINSQQEQPISPNRKNLFPQNTKKLKYMANPQKFRATR